MLVVLSLVCFVLVSSDDHHVVDAIHADPNIDLFDIDNMENLPDVCKGKECPKYDLVKGLKLPSGVEVRDYAQINWISSSRYPAIDNSCLEENEEMKGYYTEIYNYFKGVNTMGLLMERTVPIRVIGQTDPETGRVTHCYLMFYIADMYSVNAPAPLSVGIFVGHNWGKRCYVVASSGNYSWKRATKIHKALKNYLTRRKIEGFSGSEVILDIYTGYGVPNPKKYSEILLCLAEDGYY